jgi:lipid A 3-O-deacylase
MAIGGKWAVAVTSVVFTCRLLCAEEPTPFHSSLFEYAEPARWRLGFDNDIYFHKDNNLSNCWSVQRHSATSAAWESLKDMPKIAGFIGNHIPGLKGRGLAHRSGVSIAQTIQTPNDLHRRNLIKNDVPYAGVLTLQGSWYAYDDTEFRGFEITTGVVGPFSLGESSQKAFHKLFHRMLPQGWRNQLSNEPLIGVSYMRKKKILRKEIHGGFAFDSTINGNASAGNLFTHATGAIELRFGRNTPGGFVYAPNTTGYGMNYIATFQPVHPRGGALYGSLVMRATALAHSAFLDGNMFRNSHHVDKKPLVGQMIFGLHYEHKRFGVHLYTLVSSAVLDAHRATAAEERELIGSISVELWK